MKEKKGVCACACVRSCVRQDRTCTEGDGGSRGSYILSQRPAGAYLEPQGQGYFIFPKHKPQALATHTHTQLQKQCLAPSHSL